MNIFYIVFIIVALQLKIINGYDDYYDYYINDLCFGSFPLNVGGMIIIYGENLNIANNETDSVIITVGDLNCTNINFENHGKLKCDISSDDKEKLRKGDQVNIIGLSNVDEIFVLFNFDKINACSYPDSDQSAFFCNGDCFDYTSTRYLFLRTLPITQELKFDVNNSSLLSNKSINNTNGTISFEISIDNNRISINGYLSKLRAFQQLYDPKPSINGGNLKILISNEKISNDTYLTILPDGNEIKGECVFKIGNNTSCIYEFQVPKGFGRKDVKITQGDQSCFSEFEYDVPVIKSNVKLFENNSIIGFEFDKSSGIIEWVPDHIDQIKITFSNQSFYNDDIVIKGTDGGFMIGIKYLELYQMTNLIIQFGNVTVKEILHKIDYPRESSLFTIDPILIQPNDQGFYYQPPYTLRSFNGTIPIIGDLFTPNIVYEGGSFLKCSYGYFISCPSLPRDKNALSIRPNCTYINKTLVTCETKEKSSQDLSCCFKVPKLIRLILRDPNLSLISTDYGSSMDSARLTINGDGLSNYIDSITVGDENCTNILLFNPQQIFCDLNNTQIKRLATSTKTINTGQVYVNVTMDGISCGQFINFSKFEKYLNANPPNEKQSSSSLSILSNSSNDSQHINDSSNENQISYNNQSSSSLSNNKKSLPLDNSTQYNDQCSINSNSKIWLVSIIISSILLVSFFY